MNWPNALTFFRFLLIPLFIYIYFSSNPYHNVIAFLILVLAGLTDVIDGYIARKKNQITQLGIMMDPLADKLMMLAVIISFLFSGRIDLWAALIIVIRDAAMIVSSAIFHYQGKKTVPSNIFGKLTTVLFYIAFLFLMFDLQYAGYILWGVIIFSFLTSAVYLFKFRLINS